MSKQKKEYLPRDEVTEIAKTLNRLQGSTKKKPVKTASALSIDKASNTNNKKWLVILLVSLVGLTVIGYGWQILNQPNVSENKVVTIEQPAADQLADLLSNLSNLQTGDKITILSSNSEQTTSKLFTSNQQFLESIGIYFSDALLATIASEVMLDIKNVAGEVQYVVGFYTRDVPNTKKGLRDWELQANLITTDLASNSTTEFIDDQQNSQDYRTNNQGITYSVNQNLVLIGSSLDVITSNQSAIGRELKDRLR